MTKVCYLEMIGIRCYYTLTGCSNDELMNIINFKSWEFKSWKYGRERKYFSFIYINRDDEKVIWSSLGFSPILVRYLQSIGYIVNGKEIFRSKEIIINEPYYKLWEHQFDAKKGWINNGCCGVIKLPTGSGKTILACNCMWEMKLRTIICVHTSDLLINVWFGALVEQFSESIKGMIGIIGGGLTKNDRLNMRLSGDTSFKYNIKKDIVIATSQSLLNNLDELANEKFGFLIVDEAHHYPSEQFKKVVDAIRAPYRLGLSATLLRPDGMSPLIHGLLGDIVYKISIRDLVDRKLLVEPIFNTIVINDEQSQNKIITSGFTKLDLVRYIKKISSSSVIKKDYIIKLAKSLAINDKRFIIYTDFVNKSEIDNDENVFVRDDYVRELNDNGVRVVGVSSDMSGEERDTVFKMLKSGRINGLIFGKLGAEGVNIPNIDSVIMCNSTKSTILYPQRVGRAMRITDGSKKNAFIYEVCLNVEKELEWSRVNFYEYNNEGYNKEVINVK